MASEPPVSRPQRRAGGPGARYCDVFTVGSVNSILILISNAEKQVYAHDYSFNDMTPFPEKISSGATLI